MTPPLDHIHQLIASEKITEAITDLNRIIADFPNHHDAIFLRGKLHWRIGNKSAATSDYCRASRLQPDGPASRALENARDIIDFFNPDILNP